jgi:hypothetical protein
MDVCNEMYCDELHMLQTSPSAQIYLVTMETDLPSDVDKFRQLGRQPPF